MNILALKSARVSVVQAVGSLVQSLVLVFSGKQVDKGEAKALQTTDWSERIVPSIVFATVLNSCTDWHCSKSMSMNNECRSTVFKPGV